jgi:hypothetical protein
MNESTNQKECGSPKASPAAEHVSPLLFSGLLKTDLQFIHVHFPGMCDIEDGSCHVKSEHLEYQALLQFSHSPLQMWGR